MQAYVERFRRSHTVFLAHVKKENDSPRCLTINWSTTDVKTNPEEPMNNITDSPTQMGYYIWRGQQQQQQEQHHTLRLVTRAGAINKGDRVTFDSASHSPAHDNTTHPAVTPARFTSTLRILQHCFTS